MEGNCDVQVHWRKFGANVGQEIAAVFLKKWPFRSSQEQGAGQKEKRIPNKKSIEAIEMSVMKAYVWNLKSK